MHGIDIARATGNAPVRSLGHDGVLVADVATEWAPWHAAEFTYLPADSILVTRQERTMIKPMWKCRLALIASSIAASASIIIATPPASAVDDPCRSGYVPRGAYPGNLGCVTLATRAPTKYDNSDNSQALNRRPAKVAPGYAHQARALVNRERVKAGCTPLQVVSQLQVPADRQSRDHAARDRSSHRGANGSTSDSRLRGLGYSRWAENIAQWQSAKKAVNFWLRSAGHRANMLDCAFKETGLAVARSNSGKLYWTQTFGG